MNRKETYLDKLIRFKEYLESNCVGEFSSKTADELAQWGCARSIRMMVRKLRLGGYPICSGNTGYFMPKYQSDIKTTINRINNMAKSDLEIVMSLVNHPQGD